MRWTLLIVALVAVLPAAPAAQDKQPAALRAGFAEVDITPKLGERPVYLAGFGQNRKATKIHDPIMARAVVFAHGEHKVAIVSLDLVGLFHEATQRIRGRLKDFTYVLVTCTHNHDGPDTLGLWGPNPFTSGIDPDYLKLVEDGAVTAITRAGADLRPVRASIGTAKAPELLHDGREPYVKHDDLVALRLDDAKGQPAGIVVQWNCHPETLGGGNTQVSSDYVGYTVARLRARYGCPVVYLTGTVGGLMTSLHVEIKDEKGTPLKDGTFEKTERYGVLLAEVAARALGDARPLRLDPIAVKSRELYLPLDNKTYRAAFQIGMLKREAFLWTGDPYRADPLKGAADPKQRLCVRTEVGLLRLGELEIAAIPGEIYPELVLGKVQDPVDPGADFPKAAVEPSVYGQLRGPHRMLVGLANDEIGYIIPKRQWDVVEPYCYGRKRAQYGETNSLGPETAPLLCEAFRELTK